MQVVEISGERRVRERGMGGRRGEEGWKVVVKNGFEEEGESWGLRVSVREESGFVVKVKSARCLGMFQSAYSRQSSAILQNTRRGKKWATYAFARYSKSPSAKRKSS